MLYNYQPLPFTRYQLSFYVNTYFEWLPIAPSAFNKGVCFLRQCRTFFNKGEVFLQYYVITNTTISQYKFNLWRHIMPLADWLPPDIYEFIDRAQKVIEWNTVMLKGDERMECLVCKLSIKNVFKGDLMIHE